MAYGNYLEIRSFRVNNTNSSLSKRINNTVISYCIDVAKIVSSVIMRATNLNV